MYLSDLCELVCVDVHMYVSVAMNIVGGYNSDSDSEAGPDNETNDASGSVQRSKKKSKRKEKKKEKKKKKKKQKRSAEGPVPSMPLPALPASIAALFGGNDAGGCYAIEPS